MRSMWTPDILTVLGVASVKSNRLQIQAAVQVDSGHDVSLEYSISIQSFIYNGDAQVQLTVE